MYRWKSLLWLSPLVCLVLFQPLLPLTLKWVLLLFSPLLAFYGCICFMRPVVFSQALQPVSVIPTVPPPAPEPGLSYVPTAISELRAMLSDREFELFSAAVIVGLREGYRFKYHTGGSGDQGVDTLLENKHRQLVVVQSKFQADDNKVGSPKMREFAGSILHYHAAYGYFVTTTLFSSDARDVYYGNSQIRIIDGNMLAGYLKWRNREIALAWREIQEHLAAQKQ